MELRQLNWFVAIADLKSFSKAAAAAFVAQPAMSQQIQKLERELGVALFDRTSRPIRLTPAGEHLYVRATEILAQLRQTCMEVQEFSGEFRGRIVVGSMRYLANEELPVILAAYRDVHPSVELQLRIGNSGELVELLRAGDVDLAYAHADALPESDDFEITSLRVEELVIVVSRAHALAGRSAVSVHEIRDEPFITFQPGAQIHEALLRLFASIGAQPRIWFESADLATAFGLVTRGLALALVPRSVAARDPSVVALSVTPDPIVMHIAEVTRRDRPRTLALTAFTAQAREAISSVQSGPG